MRGVSGVCCEVGFIAAGGGENDVPVAGYVTEVETDFGAQKLRDDSWKSLYFFLEACCGSRFVFAFEAEHYDVFDHVRKGVC